MVEEAQQTFFSIQASASCCGLSPVIYAGGIDWLIITVSSPHREWLGSDYCMVRGRYFRISGTASSLVAIEDARNPTRRSEL